MRNGCSFFIIANIRFAVKRQNERCAKLRTSSLQLWFVRIAWKRTVIVLWTAFHSLKSSEKENNGCPIYFCNVLCFTVLFSIQSVTDKHANCRLQKHTDTLPNISIARPFPAERYWLGRSAMFRRFTSPWYIPHKQKQPPMLLHAGGCFHL